MHTETAMNDLQSPPRQLNGAEVLLWAVSDRESYHTIPSGANPRDENVVSVNAMAICCYIDGNCYCLLKCFKSPWYKFDSTSIMNSCTNRKPVKAEK